MRKELAGGFLWRREGREKKKRAKESRFSFLKRETEGLREEKLGKLTLSRDTLTQLCPRSDTR